MMGKMIKGLPRIEGQPQAILLIQLGDIGDVVLTLSCMQALKENFPQALLVVAVRAKAAAILDDCPWVDEVLAVQQGGGGVLQKISSQLTVIKQLRGYSCDIAFDLRTGDRGALLAILSGARQRIAYYANEGETLRNFLFSHLVEAVNDPRQHIEIFFLNLLQKFGVTIESPCPKLVVSGSKRQRVDVLLRRANILSGKTIVAIQPFSLWQYKEWAEEKYVELINWICATYDVSVVVTGSPEERSRAAKIVNQCGDNVYNFAGKTSVDIYAALLAFCRLFIGVDSSGLHLAAAVGTPTIGLFGPSPSETWAPTGEGHIVIKKDFPCLPCRQKGCDDQEKSRCLDELGVDEIIPYVQKQLKDLPATNPMGI